MLSTEFPVISQKVLQEEGPLLFEKISEASKVGFFYLEMPEDCRLLINAVRNYANSCFSDSALKNTERRYYDGGGNIQREQIYFARHEWTQLPKEITDFIQKTSSINIKILEIVYTWCGYQESEFKKISGGATSHEGSDYLNFSRYRPEMNFKGFGEHKDSGEATLLDIDKIGLEVNHHGHWVDIKPMKDHFVIIFGESLEVLINDREKLIAANHRVRQCTEERLSIALFTQNHLEWPTYQRIGNKFVIFKETGKEFEEYCFAKTSAYK